MGFFKAYDMRGTYGVDFDLDLVYRVGRSLVEVVGGPRWLVGRDARLSSVAVCDALLTGLVDAGARVTDLGLSTTPMVYHFTAEEDFDGSVMITASHNPPGDNGLKVSRRGAVPVGYDSGLAEVEKSVLRLAAEGCRRPIGPMVKSAPGSDPLRLDRYVDWLLAHAPARDADLRFAVDCSDGMASLFAHRLFPGAVFLNDVPDGRFPHHPPDPLKPAAREQLATVVRERGLDCGVIFDGDADRCMFVDERGDFIQSDYLIPIVASACLARTPAVAPIVIHDVRTSRAAVEALVASGARPVMGKVGHAFAKRLLRESGAICGGELAGHYYFRDFHCCDSGALAALLTLGVFAEARRQGRTVSEALAPITRKYANSGEMNFKVEDKDAAIARLLRAAESFGTPTARSDIDGVRLEFAAGWISVRKSNTEPLLRVIIECDTPQTLSAWRSRLSGFLGF